MATHAERSPVRSRDPAGDPAWSPWPSLVGAVGLTSCSAIGRVKSAVDDIRGNKATIDAFSSKLQSGAATPFEATYVTTGSAPATIVYAVQPPTGVAFDETPSGRRRGRRRCTSWSTRRASSPARNHPPGRHNGHARSWEPPSAATENKIFDFYTPSHWIGFLKGFSLAAGLAGDKVTSSIMTVNGFAMSCVDFQASGVPGTSTICTTPKASSATSRWPPTRRASRSRAIPRLLRPRCSSCRRAPRSPP